MLIEEQTTETPETPATETPAGDTATPETPAEVTEGGEAPVVAAPAYTVNPSFKVKHLEKKFDDWIIPSIKDAETEKKVRELYEKAHGLEFVKQDREGYQAENRQLKQTVQQEFLPMKQQVEKVVHFREQKDYDAVFDLVGLDKREVIMWAAKAVTQDQSARAAQETAARTGIQAFDARFQAQDYQSQAQIQMAQYQDKEFDWISQRPEVSTVIQQFDGQRGIGSFKNEVIARGQYHWHTKGQNISVQQAVDEVLSLVRWGQPAPAQDQGQGQPAQPVVATPQAPAAKPVIPVIQGKGTSPAKRVYDSMAKIEERRKELQRESQDA